MKEMIYKNKRELEVLASGKYKRYDYIILSLGTHPTAYVRVPKTHKYFKIGYNNIWVDCHGGLTYSNACISGSGIKGWWIGWDYAHLGDYDGYGGLSDYDDYRWSTEEILDEVKKVIDQLKESL